jgi:hypothetical protein
LKVRNRLLQEPYPAVIEYKIKFMSAKYGHYTASQMYLLKYTICGWGRRGQF